MELGPVRIALGLVFQILLIIALLRPTQQSRRQPPHLHPSRQAYFQPRHRERHLSWSLPK